MAAPKPSEAEALIPAANTSICSKVIRLFIQLPYMVWRIVSTIWNEDGTVTDTFKASIGLTVGGLAAPTNVAATDGTHTNKVTITWSAVTGASSYQVWRNTVDDSATATNVGSPSDTTFDDNSAVQGTVYWYWIKAVNAGGTSAFSTSNSGYAANTPSSPILFSASQSWVVPAGVTTIALDIWGGGGGGGGLWSPWSIGTVYGGGGGGSGEKRALTGLAVTPGETLNLNIGAGGEKGGSGSDGSNGGDSSLIRASSSTLLALAKGGGGGGRGGNSAGGGGTGGNNGSGGTGTNGNTGSAGTVSTGGAGGTAVDSYGAGGSGSGLSAGAAGSKGQIKITPNG